MSKDEGAVAGHHFIGYNQLLNGYRKANRIEYFIVSREFDYFKIHDKASLVEYRDVLFWKGRILLEE